MSKKTKLVKTAAALWIAVCMSVSGCAFPGAFWQEEQETAAGIAEEAAKESAAQQESAKESAAPAPKVLFPGQEETKEELSDGAAGDAKAKEPEQTGYYYKALSESEQTVYREVYRAVTSRREVSVSTLSTQELDKIFACVLNDHPEIFYTNAYVYTMQKRGEEIVKLSFAAKYTYDEAECERRRERIEERAAALLSRIPAGADDFTVIRTVFDTLIAETEYVADAVDRDNICSVFLNHTSVCQGYAKATQYLLLEAGISATIVCGTVEGGSHAWNLVMADEAWYYLDTTWGDADYQSERESETPDQTVLAVNYDYFMISSARLSMTHKPDDMVPLPDCAATKDNYYVHEGLYLTGLDEAVLHEIFDRAYTNGDAVVQFQCANDAIYEQIRQYLLDEQHIFDFVDAADYVPYYNNEETDTFYFWL